MNTRLDGASYNSARFQQNLVRAIAKRTGEEPLSIGIPDNRAYRGTPKNPAERFSPAYLFGLTGQGTRGDGSIPSPHLHPPRPYGFFLRRAIRLGECWQRKKWLHVNACAL